MTLSFLLCQHLRESDSIALPKYFAWMGKLRFQGFLLVELVIVLAIVGILAAIAVPNYIKYREKARVALAIS